MSDQKLTIAIGGKLDATLTKAVNDAQSQLDRLNGGSGKTGLSKVFSGISQAVSAVGKGAVSTWGSITSGMIAADVAAIKIGSDFESAMSQVAATMAIDKTSEEFAMVEDIAKELGRSTAFTMTEAAQGANILAMAGYEAEDIYKTLPTVLNLAGAGAIDMADSARYIATTLNTMNLDKTEVNAQHIADVFAAVASSVQIDVAGMGEAFIELGGTGATLKGGVDEAAALMGILADAGFEGAEIGTHLRNMIMNLKQARNADAAAQFEALGISAYDAEGNLRGMNEVFGELAASMQNMTEQEQDQVIADIFKVTDQAAARAMLKGITEQYGELYETATQASEGAGSSAEMYQRQLDNLQGDLDLLKSAVEAFGNTIYESIVGGEGEGLRGAVQEITDIAGDLEEAFQADGLEGLADGIGEAIGEVSTTIGTQGARAIAKAGLFSSRLVKAIGGKSESIGSAAAKIVTEIGTSFASYTEEFVIAGGQLIQGLMDGMIAEGTAEQWTTGLTGMITNIGTWFSENGAQLGESAGILVTQLATQISAHSGDILSGGIAIVGGIAKGILTGLPILITNLPNILQNIVGGVIDSVPAFLDAGKELGNALMEGLGQIATEWNMEQMRGAGEDMQYLADNAEAMNATMTELWANTDTSGMSAATQTMVENLLTGKTTVEDFNTTLESMRGVGLAEDVQNMDAALTAYTELAGTAREQLEASQQEAQATAEATAAATEATAESSVQTIEELSNSVMGQFDTAQAEAEAAGSAINEALTIDTSEMDADALSAIISAIDTGNIDQITTQFESAMSALSESANTTSTSVQTSLSDMGTNSLNSVSTSLTSMLDVMSSSFITMINNASTTATSIYSSFAFIDLYGVGLDIMSGLESGLSEAGNRAIARAREIANEVAATVKGALQIQSPSKVMAELGMFTGEGLAVGMQGAESDIYSAANEMANTAQEGTASGVLRTFIGGGPAATAPQAGGVSSAGGQVVFSPQITINGNASEADVRSALSWSIEQFRTMYRQMQAEDKRMSFA